MTTHILQTSFNGNVNVGLYGFANDKYCLVGYDVSENTVKEIQEVLKVPVHRISLCGTGLIGIFAVGNNEGILIPAITFEEERQRLKTLGVPFQVINTKLTALGNNVLVHNDIAFVNPEFSDKDIKAIEHGLNVKAEKATLAELGTIGALALFQKDAAIVHDEAEVEEVKNLEHTFGVKATRATLNRGSPYLKSAIIINSNGYVVGNLSTGIELQTIDKAFGYIV